MATPTTHTLLDLVQTVNHFAQSDNEVVATVAYLINSGKVRLGGNFAGAKIVLPSPIHPALNEMKCCPNCLKQGSNVHVA
jgi:hypothetical protein